jgi:hypothetical protein
MKFHNCELVRFTFDTTATEPGNTNIFIEDCHIKTCCLPWSISAISSIIYTNCYIDIFDQQQGNTTAGPFSFRNIDKAEFIGCTFRKTEFIDPDVTSYGGVDYPNGYKFNPYSEARTVMSIVPPKSVVQNVENADTTMKDNYTWNFRLRLIGNKFIVYCRTTNTEGKESAQFSTYKLRCVNPYDTNHIVDLDSTQGRTHVLCYGNSFVHSVESPTTYGCHAFLNKVEYVLPFNDTIFTQKNPTISTDLKYENVVFDYCDTNFDFHLVTNQEDRRGYYNYTRAHRDIQSGEQRGGITFLVTTEENMPGYD